MPRVRNPNGAYWVALEQRERVIISGALKAAKGNRTNAAKLLGIDRWFMITRMRRLGIDDKVEHTVHWMMKEAP